VVDVLQGRQQMHDHRAGENSPGRWLRTVRIRREDGGGTFWNIERETAWRLTKPQLRQTQKAIKICLTERWYSWEEARVAAMEDEEVDLFADTENGQPAFIPKEYTEVR
jgi:hypothetical protein